MSKKCLLNKITKEIFHVNKETISYIIKHLCKLFKQSSSVDTTIYIISALAYSSFINFLDKTIIDGIMHQINTLTTVPFYDGQDMKLFKFKYLYPPLSRIVMYQTGTIEKQLFEDEINNNLYDLDFITPLKYKGSFIDCVFPSSSFELLNFTAFYGSIKCFKYFLLNGISLSGDVSKYAICGRNTEIIGIIEKEGIPFKDCIELAIMFRNSSKVIDKLIKQYNNCVNENCFYYALSSFKLKTIQYLIANGYEMTASSMHVILYNKSNLLLEKVLNGDTYNSLISGLNEVKKTKEMKSYAKQLTNILLSIKGIDGKIINNLYDDCINNILSFPSLWSITQVFNLNEAFECVYFYKADVEDLRDDLNIKEDYMLVFIEKEESMTYSFKKVGSEIFSLKNGIFKNQRGEFEFIEIRNGNYYNPKYEVDITTDCILNKKYIPVLLNYQKAKTTNSIRMKEFGSIPYKPDYELIGDLFNLNYSQKEKDDVQNEDYSDLDVILTEEELIEKEYSSYEQVIIYCDYFYKRQAMNIRIKERPNFDSSHNSLRLYCSDDCSFKITARKKGEKWVITDLQKHSCCADFVNFEWKQCKETKNFVFRKESYCPLDVIADSYLLTQSNRSLRDFAKKVDKIMFDDGCISFNKIVDYIIQIKETGGDAICPVYSVGDDVGTLLYFFVIPSFCIQYINSDLFNDLVVLDGTYQLEETRGTVIIYSVVSPMNTYIPIMWGWCLTESSEYIEPSMEMLSRNLQSIPNFIIDQGPALIKSIKDVFDSANIMFCSKHLSTKKHMEKIFEFNAISNKFDYDKQLSSHLSTIKNINERLKVEMLYHSTSRFYNQMQTMGHSTNNACESINSNIKSNQKKDLYTVLETLYYMSRERMEKLLTSFPPDAKYTKYIIQSLQSYISRCGKKEVFVDSYAYGHGVVIENKEKFDIIKHNGKYECSCKREIVTGIPCIHIYVLMSHLKEIDQLEEQIPKMFKKETIEEFYGELSNPILFASHYCVDSIGCFIPPITYISRKEKRKEAFN